MDNREIQTIDSPDSRNKHTYPKQYGSIESGNWRLRDLIAAGATPEELSAAESALWLQMKHIAEIAQKPPSVSPLFPDSELITSGWEWATYRLPREGRVVKVPAGIFPEVNDPRYLENAKKIYRICREYLGAKAVETQFERRETPDGNVNLLFQRELKMATHALLFVDQLPSGLRNSLIDFARGILAMLDKYKWIPDFSLNKDESGGWDVYNVGIVGQTPTLYDFTTPYDTFRLFPERCKLEVEGKGRKWTNFLQELQEAKTP